MFARARYVVTAFLLLFFSVSAGLAQQYGPQQERRAFAQQELDQMLAPIALYPDALLSQILMAATYPVEVGEAARWSRANSDLLGDRAVRAAERMDWDPSVQSLVAFPQILAMMDEKQEWTEDLGDAFLDQQAQVMDTVQYLRQKANEAGNLRSTDQYRVDSQGSTFSITMSNPEIVYLPYYNPLIVYGTWWWPTYQPVYWAPWPGYYSRPGIARGYAWGPGIRVSRGFFFGAPDWSRRSVHVVNANAFYYRPARRQAEFPRGNASASAVGVWQHDMSRGRDNPRRDAASRPDTRRTSAAPGARQETNTTRALGQSGRDTRDGRDGRGTRQSTERAPGNAVVPSPNQPAANAAPVPARVPPVASRPNAEQRPDGANARTGSSRNAEGRGSVTREPDASPGDVRGWSRNRGDGRTDAGGRSEERGNAPRAVPNAAPPQNVERAPAAARAPVAATQPPVRAVPVQQNTPPAVVNRPNNEQRPSHDNAGQRGEQRSSGPREHAAPQAASNDNQGSPPGPSRR